MSLFRALIFSAAALSFHGGAADAPQTFTHRIHGLCCVEREPDLRAAASEIPGVKLRSIDFENAAAVFEYDPAALCAERLKNMSKKEAAAADVSKLAFEQLDKLLMQASQHTLGLAPPALSGKLELVEITVEGLDCKACSFAAYESIYKLDGVDRATASFKKGLVAAWIDPAKTNRAALEAALRKKNVDVKSAEPAPSAKK